MALINPDDFLKHIADVKTPLTLGAFAIAAVIYAYRAFLTKPNSAARRPLLVVVVVVCVIAVVPVVIGTRQADVIYRVRVTVVDAQNVPIEGAVIRATAANEAKTAPDGSAELAIPKGSLTQDGNVIIYADKTAAFVHGSKQLTLGIDPNPSVVIAVIANEAAEVKGAVQDDSGRAIAGARVSIPGGDAVNTNSDGSFRLPAHAAQDQKVLIHAEKPGFVPANQYHPAGDGPVVLVLRRERRSPRNAQ